MSTPTPPGARGTDQEAVRCSPKLSARGFRISDVNQCLESLKRGELLPPHIVKFLCAKCKEILQKEPNVRHIDPPVTVVGDVHGQFYDVLEMFRITGECPLNNFLFLGDYVDRGSYSVETMSYLVALKVRFPNRITLIRGNHESRRTTQIYGFFEECKRKYGNANVWIYFTDMFDYLPLAALIGETVFCTHGGLSPSIQSIDTIREANRFEDVPLHGPVCDLMWADPDPFKSGFSTSSRGASYVFGKDITERFMHVNHLDFIFRAHQLCQEGYQVLWGKLATVWSAPNYCYRMGNKAAVCQVSEHLDRFFLVFEAAPEHCRDSHAHAPGSPFASKALAGVHQENPGKVQSGQGQRQSVLRPFFKETDEEYSSESEPEDG